MASTSPLSDSRELSAQPSTTAEVERRCCLCGKDDGQMSRYGNTGIVEREFIIQHSGQHIPDTSWVCKKHLLEAKRYCNTTGYQPKWKRQNTQPANNNNKCGNPFCTNTEYGRLITPSFAPISDIIGIFNIPTNSVVGSPFVLCHPCYCHAYNQLHCKKSCQSCGAIPKAHVTFNRHSPNADTVSEHLKETTCTL